MEFSIQDQNQGRKMTGIVFVALLHVALIWALANGLGGKKLWVIPSAIPVTFLQDKKPEPIEQPSMKPLPFKPVDVAFVTPPEMPVVQIVTDQIRAVTAQPPTIDAVPPGTGRTLAEPVRTSPVLNAQACEKPDYPSRELRDGIEGTTVLQFLIGANGKVMNSKVARSSGSRTLDNAALAGLARCPFKAATVDGKPEPAWTKIQYVWRIE